MEGVPIPPAVPLPGAFEVPAPTLELPKWEQPTWVPIPIYREDIPDTPNPKTKPKEEESAKEKPKKPASGKPPEMPKPVIPEMAEVQTWTVPIIEKDIPIPRPEILVTATTTAGISAVAAVGGTMIATTLFRQLQPILKPIFKTLLKKLAQARKKPPPLSFGRERQLARRQRKPGKKESQAGS